MSANTWHINSLFQCSVRPRDSYVPIANRLHFVFDVTSANNCSHCLPINSMLYMRAFSLALSASVLRKFSSSINRMIPCASLAGSPLSTRTPSMPSSMMAFGPQGQSKEFFSFFMFAVFFLARQTSGIGLAKTRFVVDITPFPKKLRPVRLKTHEMVSQTPTGFNSLAQGLAPV